MTNFSRLFLAVLVTLLVTATVVQSQDEESMVNHPSPVTNQGTIQVRKGRSVRRPPPVAANQVLPEKEEYPSRQVIQKNHKKHNSPSRQVIQKNHKKHNSPSRQVIQKNHKKHNSPSRQVIQKNHKKHNSPSRQVIQK